MRRVKLPRFSSPYVYQHLSEANWRLCKILTNGGVHTQYCLLEYDNSQYEWLLNRREKEENLKEDSNIGEIGREVTTDSPTFRHKVQTGKSWVECLSLETAGLSPKEVYSASDNI